MMMASFSDDLKTEVSVNLIPTGTNSDDENEARNSELKKLTMRPYYTAKVVRFFVLLTFFIAGLVFLIFGIIFMIYQAYVMIFIKFPSWYASDMSIAELTAQAYVTPKSLVLYYSS